MIMRNNQRIQINKNSTKIFKGEEDNYQIYLYRNLNIKEIQKMLIKQDIIKHFKRRLKKVN